MSRLVTELPEAEWQSRRGRRARLSCRDTLVLRAATLRLVPKGWIQLAQSMKSFHFKTCPTYKKLF